MVGIISILPEDMLFDKVVEAVEAYKIVKTPETKKDLMVAMSVFGMRIATDEEGLDKVLGDVTLMKKMVDVTNPNKQDN